MLLKNSDKNYCTGLVGEGDSTGSTARRHFITISALFITIYREKSRTGLTGPSRSVPNQSPAFTYPLSSFFLLLLQQNPQCRSHTQSQPQFLLSVSLPARLQPELEPDPMASAANPFSVSVSSKPNNSADFFLRVQSPPNSVSLRYSFASPSSIELNSSRGGNSVLSASRGVRSGKIRASSAQVMDQSVAKTDARAPTVVEVDLGNRSYPIYIGSGLLDQPHLLQRYLVNQILLLHSTHSILIVGSFYS